MGGNVSSMIDQQDKEDLVKIFGLPDTDERVRLFYEFLAIHEEMESILMASPHRSASLFVWSHRSLSQSDERSPKVMAEAVEEKRVFFQTYSHLPGATALDAKMKEVVDRFRRLPETPYCYFLDSFPSQEQIEKVSEWHERLVAKLETRARADLQITMRASRHRVFEDE